MIHYLQIENFKSLRKLSMPVSKLNLYFGMNGMGKSSVLQTILLLRQSYWENRGRILDKLSLNGELVRLGTVRDVFCQTATSDLMRICIKCSAHETYDYKFRYDDRISLGDQLLRNNKEELDSEYRSAIFGDGFFYLGAEHIGPQKQYSTEGWNYDKLNIFGTRGEYVVPFLAEQGERIHVSKALCMDKGKTDRLIDQVSAWMSEISPGVRISAELMPYIEKARLLIGYAGERLTSDFFMPVNVGFGVPYVLPLIVMLLISGEKNLIMIENPESHLHPRGQAMMARLIAAAAANGCQILCESHSDHIINGIRVAVKKEHIPKEDVQIAYFEKNSAQETVVIPIQVDCCGNLSDYPSGLLDEWGNLMSELL